jgi:hypothetical protein
MSYTRPTRDIADTLHIRFSHIESHFHAKFVLYARRFLTYRPVFCGRTMPAEHCSDNDQTAANMESVIADGCSGVVG